MHDVEPPPADDAFDERLAPELRAASGRFWTPVAVATRVASWLEQAGSGSVVDLGAGVGKFCIVAALASRARFLGLEQRPRLVRVATELARGFGVAERVAFAVGNVAATSIPVADAYYLYNPFGEAVATPAERLDDEVEFGHARFAADVAAVERFLGEVPIGTVVVTYNGFGGQLPPAFEQLASDTYLRHVLTLWQKGGRKVSPRRGRQRDPRHTEFER